MNNQQALNIALRFDASGITNAIGAVVLCLTDLLVLIVGFVLAVGLPAIAEHNGLPGTAAPWLRTTVGSHLLFYIVTLPFVLIGFAVQGLYSKRLPLWNELSRYLKWILVSAGLEIGLLLLLSEAQINGGLVAKTWLIVLLLGLTMRAVVRKGMTAIGWSSRPVVIVGTGDNAIAAFRAFQRDGSLGCRVQAFISDGVGPNKVREHPNIRLPVFDLADGLAHIGQSNPPTQVILAVDSLEENEALFTRLSMARPDLLVAPPLRGFPVEGIEVLPLLGGDIVLMGVRNNLHRWPSRAVKRVFDIVVSAFLLVVAFVPIYLLVRFQIHREDKGPVLYTHRRIGAGGKEIGVLKFRTMVLDAEAQLAKWAKERPDLYETFKTGGFKFRDDPRLLKSCRWLRETSLDELPQLLNILRGEMSLVGPRPIVTAEIPIYGPEFEIYKQVRPGLTGLWQVSGRSTTVFPERSRLDAWYVRNWALWYDVAILFRTVWVVLSRSGAY